MLGENKADHAMPLQEQPPLDLAEVLLEELNYHRCSNKPLSLQGSPERLKEVIDLIHQQDPERAALCLSGGGIRSASFALGILQGLAKVKKLKLFSYLSTVSGGGYAGSWLMAWLRHAYQNQLNQLGPVIDPLAQVEQDLAASVTHPDGAVKQVHHLREYSNYLSPSFKLMSADLWTLPSIYLRNLLAIWCILLPFFIAVQMIPFGLGDLVNWSTASRYGIYVAFSVGVLAAFCAVFYHMRGQPSLKKSPILSFWPFSKMRHSCRTKSGSEPEYFLFCVIPLILSYFAATAGCAALGKNSPAFSSFLVFSATLLLILMVVQVFIRSQNPYRLRYATGTILICLMGGGALMGLTVFYHSVYQAIGNSGTPKAVPELYLTFAVPLLLLAAFFQKAVIAAIASNAMEDQDREWFARAGAWLLMVAIGWALFFGITLYGPKLLQVLFTTSKYQWSAIVSVIGSLAACVATVRKAFMSPLKETSPDGANATLVKPPAFPWLQLAGLLCLLLVLSYIGWLCDLFTITGAMT